MESWKDGLFLSESWTVNERVREKLIGHSYTLQEKERKSVRKGFFSAWGCWFLALMVSDKLRSLFFLHPDQADGSGIQLLNDDQGVMVLSTEQDG